MPVPAIAPQQRSKRMPSVGAANHSVTPLPAIAVPTSVRSSTECPVPKRALSMSRPLSSSISSSAVMMVGEGTSSSAVPNSSFPFLDATVDRNKSQLVAAPTTAVRSLPTQSKLFVEVERLNSRGHALLRRDGSEAEGVALLGKALWARTRFPVLQKEGDGRAPWEHGEAFVLICNQIVSRLVQTLQPSAAFHSNRILQAAEVALLPNEEDSADSFADFHPLRQFLLGATLNTVAALKKLNGEPTASIIPTLERALRFEQGRYSTLTLYNLGAAYLQAKQYDQACRAASTCIQLADHYLSLPASDSPAESLSVFQRDVATHAILGHMLLATIGMWTKTFPVALQHAKLALSCALMYLGEKNALTTRCADRLDRVKGAIDKPVAPAGAAAASGREDLPPSVPLHVSSVVGSKGFPPSQLLPYTLVLPLPDAVQDFVDSMEAKPDLDMLRGANTVIPRLVEHEGPAPQPARSSHRNDDAALPSVLAQSTFLPEVAAASSLRDSDPKSNGRLRGPSSARASVGPRRDLAASQETEGRLYHSNTPRTARRNPSQNLSPQHNAPPINPRGFAGTPGSSDRWSPESDASHRPDGRTSTEPASNTATNAAASSHHLVPKPPSRGGGEMHKSTAGLHRTNMASSFVRLQQQAGSQSNMSTVATTSVLPKAQLLAYQQLQMEVQLMLHEQQRPTSRPVHQGKGAGLAAIDPTSSSLQKSHAPQIRGPAFASLSRGTLGSQRILHQSFDGESLLAQNYNHHNVNDVMRVSDAQLRQLSILVPDHTDEDEVMWHHCATQIQKVFRSFRVRKFIVRPVKARVFRWVSAVPSGERILTAWRNYVTCKPAIVRKYQLRQQRVLNNAATVVQACARQHIGELELRARWMRAAHDHIQHLRRLQLVASSAVFLQAWWRGCMVRRVLRTRTKAARTVQRTYRIFRLFIIVRLVVLKCRIRRREFCNLLYSTAAHIQRWWRHVLPQRRAGQELVRRQAALRLHMEDFLSRDRHYWESVRHLDDDACRGIVQRWSAGYHTRKQLFRELFRRRRRLHAARVIQRWYRFAHSKHSLNRRLRQNQDRLMIKRRAEEVREAVFDLQRCMRGLQGRLDVYLCQLESGRRQAAAIKIQRVVRRMLRRGVLRHLRERTGYMCQRYLTASSRQYAATQIQSVWRMHDSRRSTAHFKQFMNTDRHTHAARIQRLVRFVLATKRAARLRHTRAASLVPRFRHEEAYCAARRIQSAVRMMICRNALRCREGEQREAFQHATQLRIMADGDGVVATAVPCPKRLLFPTTAQRLYSAICLQSAWRRFAAQMYASQLRQARQWIDTDRIATEHLHVYAIVLQCAARRFILTPKRIQVAKAERVERAVRRIQRAAKVYIDRRRALLRLLQQEEDEVLHWILEEHNFAAIRVQKHIRGFITRTKYDAFRRSVVVAQSIARGYLARRQRRLRADHREMQSEHVLAAEERNAAVTIQRAWRGTSAI